MEKGCRKEKGECRLESFASPVLICAFAVFLLLAANCSCGVLAGRSLFERTNASEITQGTASLSEQGK